MKKMKAALDLKSNSIIVHKICNELVRKGRCGRAGTAWVVWNLPKGHSQLEGDVAPEL